VKAGGTFSVELEITLKEDVGRVAVYFDVFAKGQAEPVDGFAVRGFADWLVSPVGTTIDFGTFEVAKSVRKVIPIEVRPGASVRLIRIDNPSPTFDATIAQDGKSL